MFQARFHAGLRRGAANRKKLGPRALGGDPAAVARAKLALSNGLGINRVAKLAGLGSGTEMDLERAEKAISAVQLPRLVERWAR